jgi:hypothetical protein
MPPAENDLHRLTPRAPKLRANALVTAYVPQAGQPHRKFQERFLHDYLNCSAALRTGKMFLSASRHFCFIEPAGHTK